MEAMSDTEVEILRALSPERKLAVMQGLIQQAFDLKAAWIGLKAPELPEQGPALHRAPRRSRDLLYGHGGRGGGRVRRSSIHA